MAATLRASTAVIRGRDMTMKRKWLPTASLSAYFLLTPAVTAVAMSNVSQDRTSVDPNSTLETCPVPTGAPVVPPGYYLTPNSMSDAPSNAYNNPAGHNIGTNEGRILAELRRAVAVA